MVGAGGVLLIAERTINESPFRVDRDGGGWVKQTQDFQPGDRCVCVPCETKSWHI